MKKFMLLHGVNHNMFGKRNPEQYGTVTLDEINENVQRLARELGVSVTCFQTNDEGKMVDKIHEAYTEHYQRRGMDPLQLRDLRRPGNAGVSADRAPHVQYT